MKIAYIIATNTDTLNGIGNKVLNQIKSWIDLGEDARVLAFSSVKGNAMDSIPSRVLNMNPPWGRALLGKPWRVIQFLRGVLYLFLWRPDVIYVRASEKPHGSQLWSLLSAKVICEVNSDMEQQNVIDLETGDVGEYEAGRRLRSWSQSLATCDGMVSVSQQMDEVNQKFLRGQPHAVAWNSIRFDDAASIKRTNQGNKRPKLCFVGAQSFAWNGVDLLKTFAEKTMGKLDFVVIGVSENSGFTSNVQEHPYLEKEEMLKVMAECDIGLGTMALFRKGLHECSALKIRDYLSLGMPILLAYKETAFIDKTLPEWVLEIENEEDSMLKNETGIVEFAEQWRGRSFDPEQAQPYYDSAIVEKHRLDFFREVCAEV